MSKSFKRPVTKIPAPTLNITQEDIDAGKLVGATGTEVMERAIHSHLDKYEVPREGRYVKVSTQGIEIELPPGYKFKD